jgi:hypothetical protein
MKIVESGYLIKRGPGDYYGMCTNSPRYLTLLHDEKLAKKRGRAVRAFVMVEDA